MDEKTLNAIVSSVAKEIADADMTLDTALKLSAKVKEKAKAMIQRLLQTVPNEKARATAAKYLDAIDHGERDFRF